MYTNQIKRYLSKIPAGLWIFITAYLFIYLSIAFVCWDISWLLHINKSDGFIRCMGLIVFLLINYWLLLFINDWS